MPFGVAVWTHSWGSLPELVELIALANSGHLKVHVEEYALEDAMKAYHAVASGTLAGRAVVVPS